MPGTFRYALDRFTWDAAFMGGEGSHVPPTGAVSVLDLRPDGECSKRVQSGGYGLFAWSAGATLPGSAIPLGDGYLSEIVPSGMTINAIKTALGITGTLGGATLADVFLDGVLGDQADPTGASRARPIDFTTELDRELWLANHSRVAFRRYDPAQMFAANPRGMHSHLRDLMRDQVRKADAINPQLGEKVLGALLMKCGVPRDEVKNGAPNRKSDAQKLMPNEWSNGKKNATKVREPKTIVTESWPNATTDIEATAQDNSWETIDNSPWYQTIKVVAGRARSTSPFDQSHFGRCLTAVSAADHAVSANLYSINSYDVGVCARMAAGGTRTCYTFLYRYGTERRLRKNVDGTATTLATAAKSGSLTGELFTLDVDGSTITGASTGDSDLTVTDTSITANLFGGIVLTANAIGETVVEVGPVTIDDGLSAAAGGGLLLLGVG